LSTFVGPAPARAERDPLSLSFLDLDFAATHRAYSGLARPPSSHEQSNRQDPPLAPPR